MSRETILSLSNRQAELDSLIEEQGKVLKANNIGMNEPLVDVEGFPLANIDIISVRKARRAIIYLQNDRKKLLKEIESEMALLFEKERGTASSDVQEQQCQPMEVDTDSDTVSASLEPFAVVAKVEQGQLADRMGVRISDLILQIGTLTSHNFHSISQIHTVLNNSQGGKLRFVIRKVNTGKIVTLDMDFGAPGTRLGIFAKPLEN